MRFIAIVFLLVASLHAQTVIDTTLMMSDGVRLDALYCTATTPKPQAGYPAIIWIHGFNESKEDNRERSVIYARQGYLNVAFTVRGQGNSEGEFDFFTSQRILDDLREVITYAKSFRDVNPQRVAVVGSSQGGVLAWAAAAHGMDVRTVISRIANGRFDENWAADSTLNWTFARGTFLATARIKQELKDSVNRAVQSGDVSYVRTFLRDHSTVDLEPSVSVPVLILVSTYDVYFSTSSALRQFARIPSPKRVMFYPSGHVQPQDLSQRAFVNQTHDRWLSYWLKDDDAQRGVTSPDSAVIFFDPVTNEARIFGLDREQYWMPSTPPPKGLTQTTWYFNSGGLSTQPPVGQGQRTIQYVSGLGSTIMTFRTPPFMRDEILYTGNSHAFLSADGTDSQFQMNLLLFDVDPSTGNAERITRGQAHVPLNERGVTDRLEFELNAVMHTIRAGHVLEARVHGGIGIIPNPLTEFGNDVVPPNTSSTNTLYFGGDDPSRFTVYTFDPTMLDAVGYRQSEELTPALSCYPNPIGGTTNQARTTFLVSTRTSAAQLLLFDNLGRRVATLFHGGFPGERRIHFDASALPSGWYHAVLLDGKLRTSILVTLIR